jgi:hypothetical protein
VLHTRAPHPCSTSSTPDSPTLASSSTPTGWFQSSSTGTSKATTSSHWLMPHSSRARRTAPTTHRSR